MKELTLAHKVLALTGAFEAIPHAFGGALALAYYAEPRATIDIDLNVFIPGERFADVGEQLCRIGAATSSDDRETAELVKRDGQARVMWDATPIDLFFAYDPFHHAAARAVRHVPFGDATIPILGPEHLIVCKVIFNRAKDWVDLDAMLECGTSIDGAEVLRWVGRIAGDTDPRFDRIAAVLTRAAW